LRGACLVIVPRERIMNLQRFVEYGKTQKVTVAILPPSYLHTLPVDSLPHLRTLITAGESPQIHDVKQWRKKVTYINAYGPTESSICTTYYKVQPDDDLDTPIPAGKPLQNFDVYVVDKNNQRMPIGIVGEIIVGGAYLAQGYWKKDELTKQSFVSHPFKEGMRLYRTGDYGYWRADGELVFVGRRDDQVKIRGYRVELREVEKNISAFDSVTETVVMQHKRNNGNSDLIGYVVSSQKVEWEQLRMYLRKTLPDYMIPSLWVALDEIPLLPNRKVDHSQLPLPAKDTFCTAEIVHAETDMEQQILAVWKTVLGIDDLGVTQRFFEYGGDSIRAIQIVSQLKDVGLELDVRDLFQYQTVRELAHYLKQCSPASFTAKQKQYTSPGMSRVKMSAEEFESIFDDE
jgi:acyl carrier protein